MNSEHTSLIGQQLGIYQVQASLGRGGMAQVYKAYHPHLRRDVAIKVILSDIAERADFQERFKREAQMAASLEHSNIVSVYDFGEAGPLTYLVMQYVGGGTLRDQLRGKQPLEPQHAIRYASQMAQALHHAHLRGIIHRDVKPQNMLVSSTDHEHLLLSDFGIAKLYYQEGEDSFLTEMPTRDFASSALTSASQIIGTADYMSPEQASRRSVDARSDVYALGVVLYQMLVGDIPFHSTTFHGLLFQHLYTPPPPVLQRNPLVPEILAYITEKALAKVPADRFQTAEAMARALDQANAHATLLGPDIPGRSPFAPGMPIPRPALQAQPQSGIDRRATVSTSEVTIGHGRAVSAPTPPRQAIGSGITGTPQTRPGKRRLPLSFLLTALVIIIGLATFSLRWFATTGNTSPTPTPSTSAPRPFHEQFQNNLLGWPTGTISPGITASTPGEGAYVVTISTTTTFFPYPQAVSLLPENFTLTATLLQTASTSDNPYGIAFHFTQVSNTRVTCYALIVTGQGQYTLYEYTNASQIPIIITSGTYQAGSPSQAHTLSVSARGDHYSFVVDGRPITLSIGAQAPSTTWINHDLQGGRLALLFAGPNPGETSTSFKATDVQYTLP